MPYFAALRRAMHRSFSTSCRKPASPFSVLMLVAAQGAVAAGAHGFYIAHMPPVLAALLAANPHCLMEVVAPPCLRKPWLLNPRCMALKSKVYGIQRVQADQCVCGPSVRSGSQSCPATKYASSCGTEQGVEPFLSTCLRLPASSSRVASQGPRACACTKGPTKGQ
eukprot:scaffold106408_cov19-Tisochrysis_lutea.AAC.1